MIDSGANCNIISRDAVAEVDYDTNIGNSTRLDGIGGSSEIVGRFWASIQVGEATFENVLFYVADKPSVPLILGIGLFREKSVIKTCLNARGEMMEFLREVNGREVWQKVNLISSPTTTIRFPRMEPQCCSVSKVPVSSTDTRKGLCLETGDPLPQSPESAENAPLPSQSGPRDCTLAGQGARVSLQPRSTGDCSGHEKGNEKSVPRFKTVDEKVSYLKSKYDLSLCRENKAELGKMADLLIEYEDLFGPDSHSFP